ncbi:MAG TPA: zf-HC2 domain-containing protein [Longimicrobiales bacterium]|nr:zf-HC2 domain-containing protein [Longimicrobiales bacterium]
MSDAYMDRLSEYLDGSLDAGERQELEQHLAGCEPCRATLEELRSIVGEAGALQPVEPLTDLWPGIAARIESEREVSLPLAAGGAQRRGGMRRLSFTLPQLAAAAVVLVLASAGSVWMLTGGERAGPANPGAPAGAIVPVSTATPDSELAELEAALAGGERQLDPATVAVLRRNLLIIEQALVESRTALQADPANPYLSRHYENTLNKKRELLLQAGSIARGST